HIRKERKISEYFVPQLLHQATLNGKLLRDKKERQDVYQAPYVWVKFNQVKPNVLINVICRVFDANINFDKQSSRALTRFQIYIKDIPKSILSS
ncbi:unnamed protein product, partial [Rotaria sordida]